MSRPGDHIAAGHGRPEVTHAGHELVREHVIEVLKTAFAQGRLTKDEFGTRIDHTLTSQTYAELTEVTADLPPGLVVARPSCQIARPLPRVSMNTGLTAGAFALIAALVGMIAAISSRNGLAVLSVALIIALLGLLAFGALIVTAWRGRTRSPTTRRPDTTAGLS